MIKSSKAHDRLPVLLVLIATLVIWPATRMAGQHSIARSDEGGRCDEAVQIAAELLELLDGGDVVLVSSPCSAPLIYYGDQAGLSREHFAPVTGDQNPNRQLFAVQSPRGESRAEMMRYLDVPPAIAQLHWGLWKRFGEVEVWKASHDFSAAKPGEKGASE